MDTNFQIDYRWIYRKKNKAKNCYFFIVLINNEYKYSSSCVDDCVYYLLNFAEKHGISKEDLIKNGKHKRIKL